MHVSPLWFADELNDSHVKTTGQTVTHLTSTHERSVDVTRWQVSDIDVWIDTNDLKHLRNWSTTYLTCLTLQLYSYTAVCGIVQVVREPYVQIWLRTWLAA